MSEGKKPSRAASKAAANLPISHDRDCLARCRACDLGDEYADCTCLDPDPCCCAAGAPIALALDAFAEAERERIAVWAAQHYNPRVAARIRARGTQGGEG